MRYRENAPVASMAERLGKSVAAVKFQLFDVRRRLRECVDRKIVAEER